MATVWEAVRHTSFLLSVDLLSLCIRSPAAGARCRGIAGAQPLLPQAWSRVPSPRSGPGTRGTPWGTAVMCVAWVRVMRLQPLRRNSRLFHLCINFMLHVQVYYWVRVNSAEVFSLWLVTNFFPVYLSEFLFVPPMALWHC